MESAGRILKINLVSGRILKINLVGSLNSSILVTAARGMD